MSEKQKKRLSTCFELTTSGWIVMACGHISGLSIIFWVGSISIIVAILILVKVEVGS